TGDAPSRGTTSPGSAVARPLQPLLAVASPLSGTSSWLMSRSGSFHDLARVEGVCYTAGSRATAGQMFDHDADSDSSTSRDGRRAGGVGGTGRRARSRQEKERGKALQRSLSRVSSRDEEESVDCRKQPSFGSSTSSVPWHADDSSLSASFETATPTSQHQQQLERERQRDRRSSPHFPPMPEVLHSRSSEEIPGNASVALQGAAPSGSVYGKGDSGGGGGSGTASGG
ncbi:unnamed protein product, partial [Scytosiphon promiscuus]